MQSSTASPTFVEANNLNKKYGNTIALDNASLTIGAGEIVGLIGPNGAGKSTLLKAIMGLIKASGDLRIFGRDPAQHRTQLLQNMSYIADVASLPGWMKISDLLDFVAQTHPRFDTSRVQELLRDTPIKQSDKVEALSKGMKTRLHLAVILAINTDFLVLDEPTLGLDVLVRREFQDRLVADYYNQQRSILITTHQVDEIESILTRVIFIKEGRITIDFKMSDLKTRYCKLLVDGREAPINLPVQPIYQRQLPEQWELIFADVDSSILQSHGTILQPSLEDLFVATNG